MNKMLNRLAVGVLVFGLSLGFGPIGRAQQVMMTEQAQIQEQLRHRNMLTRMSDWFATVGKSQQEKNRILEQRQLQRQEHIQAAQQTRDRLRQQDQDRDRQRIHQNTTGGMQRRGR